MSIIRVVHNKENPYVQLNKAALWNENLSLKATGLWARCMSRPDNWRFNIKELVSKSREGRRAIDGAIKELIEHNYAVRVEHWEKSEDGKFTTGGVEYVFFEFAATQEDKDKVLEEFKKSFRHCGFGNCRNGDRQNDDLLKNNTILKKESHKKPPNPQKGNAPEGAVSEVLAFGEFVTIEKEAHQKLCEEHGFETISSLIDEVNDYLASTGKKPYKDYAATIRQWLRRRKQQAPKPQSQTQNDSKLTAGQERNFNENKELVDELKVEHPDIASGLNWFYKYHVLKDKNDPGFDISGLISHADFCRVLGKHLGLKIYEAKFLHGKKG